MGWGGQISLVSFVPFVAKHKSSNLSLLGTFDYVVNHSCVCGINVPIINETNPQESRNENFHLRCGRFADRGSWVTGALAAGEHLSFLYVST